MANLSDILNIDCPPASGGGINYTVDVFTSSGTYTKPANLDYAYVLLVSGGGGGGSGRRGAANTNRGGGRGQSGYSLFGRFLNSDLNATETVTVGSAGVGAAGQTTDNTNGVNGTGGGGSEFKHGINFFISGVSGLGGSTTIVSQFNFNPSVIVTGNRYAFLNLFLNAVTIGTSALSDSNRVNAAGSSTGYNVLFSNGSTGGQIRSTNVRENAGGLGGFYNSSNVLTGEITGTIPEANGIQPTEYFTFGEFFNKLFPWFDAADLPQIVGRSGLGGGCGDLAGTVAGGNGADAIGYGAGGGGGGASTNGANSGAGGNGGPGIVIIINVLTS